MSEMVEARTIPQLVADAGQRFADHLAVVDGDTRLTYRDLQEEVMRVSRAYLALGVQPGDRVGIWLPNRVEFILAMLGAQSIGAAVVPLNTRYVGREAHTILGRSRASVLVLEDGFLGLDLAGALRSAGGSEHPDDDLSPVPGLPNLHTIVVVNGEGTGRGELSWTRFLSGGEVVPLERAIAATQHVTEDDVVDVLFTSGTTGIPKGVMSAHRQTLGVATAWAKGAELTSDDNYAIVNPFFHGFGYKAGMISALVAGSTIYPVAAFNADALLKLIEDEKISVLPGVPTIFTTLLDHPHLKDYDLSSLRFSIAGATTAPATLFHDMVTVLGFATVAQAYGLTECVVATMSRPHESVEHASQTTGPAIVGMEIKIVDAEGNEVETGVDGEILLRGEYVMLGYFEDQAATDAVVDEDHWFHTGDVGRLDEHGCLKITDRLKDMFIVGGFNVYPAEVENVLRRHPAVNESAVIGIDDARMGSVGRAYVALYHDASPVPTAEELVAFCKVELAGFKVPREIIFVDDFPRGGTGKIAKSELREKA